MGNIKKIDQVVNAAFINEIKILVEQSRRQAYAAVNQLMVDTYWNISKRIVEEEQHGQNRAEYGKQLIKPHSKREIRDFRFKEMKILAAHLEGYGQAKVTVGRITSGKHLIYCVTSLNSSLIFT